MWREELGFMREHRDLGRNPSMPSVLMNPSIKGDHNQIGLNFIFERGQ